MLALRTLRTLMATTGVAPLLALPASSAVAQPAPDSAAGSDCVVTGYVAESPDDLAELRETLDPDSDRVQPVQEIQGVPLHRAEVWEVPAGATPVVVVERSGPLPGGAEELAVLGLMTGYSGREYEGRAENPSRYYAELDLPEFTRSVGLVVTSGPCRARVVLSVDRSLFSTQAGILGVGLVVLFGSLTVLVARLRNGAWSRRFLSAVPVGLVAGSGQALVLYEAGVLSPFTIFPWWAPAAGVVLAALLPLTRWRRRGSGERPPGEASSPVSIGGWRTVAPYTRTEVAEVHRAARGEQRALLKVAALQRAGEPDTRLRLEHEIEVLSGVDHPNLARLVETVRGDGPPALVFDDLGGPPLRKMVGRLTGPQAVTVALEVLAGLGVLHARGLVHRSVDLDSVWLDADGRVVLANLELACAGVEHAVAAAATTARYASPEQVSGRVLDGRSDLYACAAMLRELLGDPVPAAVQRLLEQALDEAPERRPSSVAEFAVALRQAAYEGYGADWVGRGALAGALAAHGAIGGAAIGWGGGASGAAHTVGPASTGTAGLGPAGPGAGLGYAESVPPAATGSVASGKAAIIANVGAACVAGAVLGGVAVIADPEPAEARQLVITPEQARIIFARTVVEGAADDFEHFDDTAAIRFGELPNLGGPISVSELTEVRVGVPPDQFAYPAWFVGSAAIARDGGRLYVFGRFDRSVDTESWRMTSFFWSLDDWPASPATDDDGWLAPAPTDTDLAAVASELPTRYADWLDRSWEALAVVDAGFEIQTPDPYVQGIETSVAVADRGVVSVSRTTDPGAEPWLVPLADRGALASFTVTTTTVAYNGPDYTSGPCNTEGFSSWGLSGSDVPYRELDGEYVVSVLVRIPPGGSGPDSSVVLLDDGVVAFTLPLASSVPC